MGIDFTPQNALEQAIHDHNSEMVIYAIAENHMLTTLAPASNLGSECFSDEVIFSVLFNAVTEKQLRTMTNGWFWGHLKAGERLRKLVDEALEPLPQKPSDEEKALIKAIVYGDSNSVLQLVREKKMCFHGFAPELLLMFPELSPEAVLAILKDGLSAKLKGIVLRILLKETEKADLLKSFSYRERVKYANMLLHLLAGENLSPAEGLFPDHIHENFTYCFDPAHQFDPADGRKVNIVWKEGERF
ncbi:MAG: hypothetical protein IKC08_08055 [Lentisphaeria bacterium]|nr:hypothetical protein [Lentisphaeria bacterium]